ncbi:PH domain-containing protein [Pseudoalteromonas shioyasakiensis]|uniref:PH domain-containing protein n=1 Tax=Pseudoalteromonas TaxID=53246 RepID=UPI000C929AAA|nr:MULTISPECIES: PH domain-containing protein [Pseudoalteromonas]MAD04731.1 helicase [Pseudoalteromonas sp.]MCG9709378.1 PH domain-containing protein [Pseudoalteromonas sp. Isolate3]MCP4588690.1 PH domain-containing protein [Pseudoalteromonas sp.]MCQ8882615.1 PH domain-containing protein [Pseudoalteromonas shioyasakiensis]NIZ04880.1 PH domain-containing protein [Pseudoalteromonas sp. HF66]|tara:strand:+ start:10837 stop:11211 length:375 start_codon:yes stop_codon:yes gene_type:complete
MGLLSGLMGNASEVDNDDLEELLANTLIDGETVQRAYKVIRDMFIFTNKRLIIIDKQGVTGSKVEMLSIAYSKITKFSKESAGHFDLDAELKIWVGSDPTPISKDFKAGDNINEVYRIISQFAL